jgi:DNA-3-methyladenine glycosylase I
MRRANFYALPYLIQSVLYFTHHTMDSRILTQIRYTRHMDTHLRCKWSQSSATMRHYHDKEWGVPLHDDLKLFEFLILETFQAGLSWAIVLNKREAFRKAFADFIPTQVAMFDEAYAEHLRNNTDIIRNRLKIAAAITNAHAFIKVQEEFGSFDAYIWKFVGNKPINNSWETDGAIPAFTEISDHISKDLKTRGFKFVGTTVVYAHMQATGMVNDHVRECFRYKEINALSH